MRSRSPHSSSRTPPLPARPSLAPFDYCTRAFQEVLDLHEKATGVRLYPEALRTAAVTAALEDAARRELLKARRRQARAAGRRAGTISARWNGTENVAYLRLSGHWLRAAGFDRGQAFEIEVHAGKLVIRAV